MWIFFSAPKVINRMRDETSSGGLLANDCLVHFSVSSLPFGGVGEYTHGLTLRPNKMCVHTAKLSLFTYRKQWYGLLPRQVHLWSAKSSAQLSHQTAENGGDEQHAVPASHDQQAGLGAFLLPEDRRPGLDGADGAIGHHGWGGCRCTTGELMKNETRLYRKYVCHWKEKLKADFL